MPIRHMLYVFFVCVCAYIPVEAEARMANEKVLNFRFIVSDVLISIAKLASIRRGVYLCKLRVDVDEMFLDYNIL